MSEPVVGDIVGTGRTAVLVLDEDGHVRKRFGADVSHDVAQREADNTRLAARGGLSVPEVHDVRRTDGRSEIVFSYVPGPEMRTQLAVRPWQLIRYARLLARLQREVHDIRPSSGVLSREYIRETIAQSPAFQSETVHELLTHLDSLPEGDRLCHGDLHPENVILGETGPVIIDWLDASVGPPAADVARTNLLLRFGGGPTNPVITTYRELFRRVYLLSYCHDFDCDRSLVRHWEVPVAAARISEGVPERDRLMQFVHARLTAG